MRRTQIQLPEPLYRELKRVAEQLDWSLAEVLRRGAEYIVRCYPEPEPDAQEWQLPDPVTLGSFQASVEDWRELAWDTDDRG